MDKNNMSKKTFVETLFIIAIEMDSCNYVALHYFTFGYLPGEGFNSVGSLLWRKNMLMHYLVFPMIFTLCYP